LTDALKGTPYAMQPISAVVFLVPGAPTATPFDFCINGFTYGTAASDAPDGPVDVGDQMGTVGGTGTMDLDFDRKKVVVDGENYIIQNNNWGNPNGSDCILSYLNNSFTVTTCNGSGSSAPAAFPSIYIGNNGNTANGVLSTKSTDNLPRQISAITSVTSSFRYSGGAGAFNACYDIWFANAPPTVEYGDGIDGFVMIWLRDPSGFQPIGSNQGSVMIAGQAWNVWVGPRGDGPEGYNDAPVVSYVNPAENDNSRAQSFVNVNLKAFFTDAAGRGIPGSMYLTDVFGGFEIWNGGVGAKVDEFKAVVE
jgi:endoglucanase